jgi:hypothetical protein
MKSTKSWVILIFILLPVIFGISSFRLQKQIVLQPIGSPFPTFDPLVETPLPPNPSELELGENLYWHWCMTCHGDKGQGLTDEFRSVWEPDHQNCWARGCHTGRRDDLGFPIPTIVPAIVESGHLSQFESSQVLADYLKATHPPQSPGILNDEEYHAIAFFVFSMNKRSINTPSPVPIPVFTPLGIEISTAIPSGNSKKGSIIFWPAGGLIVLVFLPIIVFVALKKIRNRKKNTTRVDGL